MHFSNPCIQAKRRHPPGPELISEEVKLYVRIRSSTPVVLAIDDLGLCRMHLKSARLQPRSKLGPNGLCFLLGPAVHQSVVSIPTPRKVGMCPRHPEIKRIMQEQIGKYWADHAPLRGSTRPLNELPIPFH